MDCDEMLIMLVCKNHMVVSPVMNLSLLHEQQETTPVDLCILSTPNVVSWIDCVHCLNSYVSRNPRPIFKFAFIFNVASPVTVVAMKFESPTFFNCVTTSITMLTMLFLELFDMLFDWPWTTTVMEKFYAGLDGICTSWMIIEYRLG